MTVNWRNFSSEEAFTDVAAARRSPDPTDLRTCPHCDRVSLKTVYLHYRVVDAPPKLIVQIWCSECRRFAGWITDVPGGLSFADPISSERQRQLSNVSEFFAEMDRLWDEGVLPQTIEHH